MHSDIDFSNEPLTKPFLLFKSNSRGSGHWMALTIGFKIENAELYPLQEVLSKLSVDVTKQNRQSSAKIHTCSYCLKNATTSYTF